VSDLALPYVVPSIASPVLERIKDDNFLKTLKKRKDRVTRLDSRPFDLTMDLTSTAGIGDSCVLIWYVSAIGSPRHAKQLRLGTANSPKSWSLQRAP